MLFVLDYGDPRGIDSDSQYRVSACSLTEIISKKMLDRLSLIDADGNRRYLLEKTQHSIGGFGKEAGDPPGE